jgi:GDP-L-fucose synthase
MKILITGTNGFIGSALCKSLEGEHEITCVTRNNCDLTKQDDVKQLFSSKYFDVVLHCAIKGGSRLKEDSWSVMDDNLKMYYNLVENRSHFGKLISFGSGAEIFANNEPYGLSKKVISQSISEQPNFYSIKIFSLFGEDELETRFIKSNIKRYLNCEPMIIHQDRDMDFFYMEDFISLVKYYINTQNPPKEVDCTYSNTYSLHDIAKIINLLGNYNVDIKVEKGGYGDTYYGIFKDLGIAYVGLEEGIKKVYKKIANETNIICH